MTRPALYQRMVLILGASLSLTGCFPPKAVGTSTQRAAEDVTFPIGGFSLRSSTGQPISNEDLHGKVWIASFIFTRCPGPCKEVTATVARLQSELADIPDVRFVSITLDPKHDSANVLQDYARTHGALPDRWLFLTGDETIIHDLFETRFKQSVGLKPGPNVKPGEEFTGHSTRLAVVDKKGVIRGFFDGTRSPRLPPADADSEHEATVQRLIAKVRELVQE